MLKKYLRRLFAWFMLDNGIEAVPSKYANKVKSIEIDGPIGGTSGLNFTVFNATGGKVIQFASYDPTRDHKRVSLYVVTDKDNLGEELAQIITREGLSR